MSIYQTLHGVGGEMLVSHSTSALGLEFALNLNSRMRGFEHFALVPLNDQDKAQVLTGRAHAKGYELTDTVLDYWLRRGPRVLSTLVADLQRLDQATLEHQRLLTVPLLKRCWVTDMSEQERSNHRVGTIAVVGGGSAGHGASLPVIDELLNRQWQIHFIGTRSEERLLDGRQITFHGIAAGKLRRYLRWHHGRAHPFGGS